MKLNHLIPLLAAFPAIVQAQHFTFGVQGGAPAQTPLEGTDNHMPFVLGPVMDIRLSSRFSLESGVLFHRMGTVASTGIYLYPANSVTVTHGSVRGRAIEVPLLAKYHFVGAGHNLRPFVIAGPTIRRTWLDESSTSSIFDTPPSGVSVPPGINGTHVKWNFDPVVGAGVDFKSGRFHLDPQVRYSYWGAGKNSPVRKNQIDFLLGFRF